MIDAAKRRCCFEIDSPPREFGSSRRDGGALRRSLPNSRIHIHSGLWCAGSLDRFDSDVRAAYGAGKRGLNGCLTSL